MPRFAGVFACTASGASRFALQNRHEYPHGDHPVSKPSGLRTFRAARRKSIRFLRRALFWAHQEKQNQCPRIAMTAIRATVHLFGP